MFLALNDCILSILLSLFLISVFLFSLILLHCRSFCHENIFLIYVNIPGNKAHFDSDSDLCVIEI